MPTETETVSVVIVTYNSMPPLENCLRSIKAGINGTRLEIINVDNSSIDGSTEMVRKYFPDAKIIRNERNVGFGRACNLAAESASGDYLLFLNPDLEVDKNAIERLLDVCRRQERVGTAVGRMRFPDGTFQATCRRYPEFNNMLFSRGSVVSRLVNGNGQYTLPDYDAVTPVPAAAGTMMMIRRKLFREIGGFDTRFFMFMEDVDLCLRLGLLGYRNYFVPDAGAVHLWGRGSRVGKFRRNLYHHINVWRYFMKHHPNILTYTLLPFALTANLLLVTVLPVPQPVNRRH
jgi:GT2 family glycosyltransferase